MNPCDLSYSEIKGIVSGECSLADKCSRTRKACCRGIFKVDSERFMRFRPTLVLSEMIPEGKVFVSESLYRDEEDVKFVMRYAKRKPDAFLVGTSLMGAKDRASLIKKMVEM